MPSADTGSYEGMRAPDGFRAPTEAELEAQRRRSLRLPDGVRPRSLGDAFDGREFDGDWTAQNAAIEGWAKEAFPADVLDRAARRLRSVEGFGELHWTDQRDAWYSLVQHEQQREATLLTDAKINAMSLDEFKKVWDMATDKPREGYEYVGAGRRGDGAGLDADGLDAANLAAAGLGSLQTAASQHSRAYYQAPEGERDARRAAERDAAAGEHGYVMRERDLRAEWEQEQRDAREQREQEARERRIAEHRAALEQEDGR